MGIVALLERAYASSHGMRDMKTQVDAVRKLKNRIRVPDEYEHIWRNVYLAALGDNVTGGGRSTENIEKVLAQKLATHFADNRIASQAGLRKFLERSTCAIDRASMLPNSSGLRRLPVRSGCHASSSVPLNINRASPLQISLVVKKIEGFSMRTPSSILDAIDTMLSSTKPRDRERIRPIVAALERFLHSFYSQLYSGIAKEPPILIPREYEMILDGDTPRILIERMHTLFHRYSVKPTSNIATSLQKLSNVALSRNDERTVASLRRHASHIQTILQIYEKIQSGALNNLISIYGLIKTYRSSARDAYVLFNKSRNYAGTIRLSNVNVNIKRRDNTNDLFLQRLLRR